MSPLSESEASVEAELVAELLAADTVLEGADLLPFDESTIAEEAEEPASSR